MAWLKFDVTTPEKPEVLAITIALGWDDPDLTVGKLLKVWRWFDQHTVEGNAKNVTEALLDRLIGVAGMSKAMADVGWLSIGQGGLILLNFETHNGKTAKDRALTASRVANYKANAKSNGASVTSALAREEKRREDKDTLPAKLTSCLQEIQIELPTGFLSFWKAWPITDRKQAKGKCFDAWKKAGGERQAAAIVAHVERLKASPSWVKSDGEFIPAPLVYLNKRSWEGTEDAPAAFHERYV